MMCDPDHPLLLEHDIIEAAEAAGLPSVCDELVQAKNYLKTQSAASGDTLYDHLTDIVHRLLRTQPIDAVDNFEAISWEIKQDKLMPDYDPLTNVYLPPDKLYLANINARMTNIVSENAQQQDTGEEELALEDESDQPSIHDLVEDNFYFKQAGFGLSDDECYNVFLALKYLSIREPVSSIRFFGKILGTEKNYYVAEVEFNDEELDRRIKLFDYKDMPGEGADEAGPDTETRDEIEIKEHLPTVGEGEEYYGTPEPKEPEPPTLPPVPVSQWKPPVPVPQERPGSGLNRKGYYVCNYPGEEWICLPDVTPQQIDVARKTVRSFTGNLDAEVILYPPFDGTERNYLRAQISRIVAATLISPQGYYSFGSGEEEEDMEEGDTSNTEINLNPYYQGHILKDLLDLNFWVHHSRYILDQGRNTWWNPNVDQMDEEVEEEEEDAIGGTERIPPEIGPNLLSSLSEDDKLDNGILAWKPRQSTNLMPERAIVTMESTLWPGAVAYSTLGKKSGCIYIGWGIKRYIPNYEPATLPKLWEEYPLGPEIMEIADPTFAEEEAWRIAHLPPQPTMIGEGEGEGLGEEEEEEEEEDEEEEEEEEEE